MGYEAQIKISGVKSLTKDQTLRLSEKLSASMEPLTALIEELFGEVDFQVTMWADQLPLPFVVPISQN